MNQGMDTWADIIELYGIVLRVPCPTQIPNPDHISFLQLQPTCVYACVKTTSTKEKGMHTIHGVSVNVISRGSSLQANFFPIFHEAWDLLYSENIVFEGWASAVWVVGGSEVGWSKGVVVQQ